MGQAYTVSEYLRNREVRIELVFALGIAAVGGTLCAFLPGGDGGLFLFAAVFLMWAVMMCFHFVASFLRYCRIAELGMELDRRIYAKDIQLLDHMEEGELSILENEINKLLSRLGEQNRELARDRSYLADSLTDLSHQLRTPLTSMNLICSLLEEEDIPMADDPVSESRRLQHFGTLRSLLVKVQWLIEILLKISKLDANVVSFERQSCGLNELARDAVEPLLIPLELSGICLIWEIEKGAKLCVDKKWTMEAVTNIVKNCMEHTLEGGTITLSGRENALYTELVIADSGPGIAPEDLPHLFTRFYKGKNSSEESVGIGLALAGMIIARQNGTIKAENGNEGGARFVLRIYKDSVSAEILSENDNIVT